MTHDNSHDQAEHQDRRPTLARRSVLRTAAWTVPVVSVVAAAPAFAVSPPGDLDPGLWLRLSADRLTLEADVVLDLPGGVRPNQLILLIDLVGADAEFDTAQPNAAWQRFQHQPAFVVFSNVMGLPGGVQRFPTLRIPLTQAPTSGSVTVRSDGLGTGGNVSGTLTF